VDEGIFNFALVNNAVSGTRYSTTHNNTGTFTGIVSGNSLTIDDKTLFIDDSKVTANLTTSEGTEKLVVTGKRTL
jgi:hypothetical protein